RRKAHVAALESSHALSLAAVFRDAPDVGQATAIAIADEIYIAVMTPHRPRIQTVEISQLRELLRRDIFDPDIGLVCAEIGFTTVRLALSAICAALAVG